jgi:outer membrane protein TolC
MNALQHPPTRVFHYWATALVSLFSLLSFASAQQPDSNVPNRLNLHDAVELALRHNHVVHIAALHVEEEQHAKEVARSAYLPTLRNDSVFAHVTDTQFIEIPAGAFGTVGGTTIPQHPFNINQGEKNFISSGTGLTQPLTELFKIRAGNDVARADLKASREKARGVENDVALKVRELYYDILVVQSKHQAVEAKIRAFDDLQGERVQQVKYGSTLEVDLIESKAQLLQAKQDLLTTELQLSDLRLKFNDVVGFPLKSEIALDPAVPAPSESCEREQCIKIALDSHPEINEAQAEVEKASAGVRAAKREYIPDIEAFARYSYQENVPFLARNFGTFGVHFGYDLFDGGKKRATLKERDAQLAQAKENLARISDEIEVRVQTAYNKLERTQQMVAVSQQLLATRQEAQRVSVQQLQQGTYLRSQADAAAAQEFEAQTILLQSQLEYAEAQDELTDAIGQTAR